MKTKQQVIRFMGVGAINTLVGYSLYAFFISLGVRYFLSLLFATFLGLMFNFFTTAKIVFKRFDNKNFFKFLLVYLFLYFTSVIFIKILSEFRIDLYVSGIIVILLSIPAFLLNKYFVFKESDK
jgi:putative flippase GtrA